MTRRKRKSAPTPVIVYQCPYCNYDMRLSEMVRKNDDEVVCFNCGRSYDPRKDTKP
jgi:transcription elongation factor Elf1